MANKPTKAEYEGFKKAVANPMTPAPIKQKLQSIIDEYSSEYEGSSEAPKAEPKSRAGRKPSTPRATKKTASPRATKKTATDIEQAKAEIKAKTGKTEAECEAIIEQYRSLRSKAQEGKRKAEQATATNKKRVAKLEDKGDLIEGTNVKTADAVIETTAQDVAEKIEQQIEAVEEKAEKEAVAEVAKDNTKKTPTEKKQAVEAKVEKKVKEKTRVIVKKVVIDTTALLTSIATSLGKFDKDSQKEFLIKLRSDIDKLLAKYAFGGMTDGAVQTMNVQQSNLSASSVNPTLFAKGGSVGEEFIHENRLIKNGFELTSNKEGIRVYEKPNYKVIIDSKKQTYTAKLFDITNPETKIYDKKFPLGRFIDLEFGTKFENGGGVEDEELHYWEVSLKMPNGEIVYESVIADSKEDAEYYAELTDSANEGAKVLSVKSMGKEKYAKGGGVSSDQRRKGYIYGYEFDNPNDTETFRNYLDRENIDYYSRNGVIATKKSISNNELSNIGIKQKFSQFAKGGGVEGGAKIRIDSVNMDVYEDSYEEGEGSYVIGYSRDDLVGKLVSPKELVKFLSDELDIENYRYNYSILDGAIFTSKLVDEDSNTASERQKAEWKKGDLTLYSENTRIGVSIIHPTETTDEELSELTGIGLYKKGGKVKMSSKFANGGGVISVYELRKGDKIKTRKGDIETIERKIESGYFTYESKYSHPFESIEFVERPKRKMADGGGVDGKGRYHILGEVKGKKPILFASTDDKKSISKIVKQADRDFFDLTGKKHEIFVTDSITDEEVFHYADGGVVGQEIVFDDSGEENTGVIKEITNLGDYVVKSDDGRTLLAQRDLDVISFGAMRQQGVEQRKKRFGFFKKGGLLGSSAQLEFIDEAFASSTLQDALREKLGLDEDTNRVGDNVVISFAYTDYGGDFLDKVAIEYFQRFYPDNTLVEYAGYNGENAFVFGEPAQEWIDSTEDYPLGFDDIESFYYEKVNESESESYEYFLDDLERDDYVFDREEVLEWLMENRGGYYSMTTQGLDFSYSDLTDELLEEGLISKEDDDDDDEYARGGGIKDVIVYDNNGETFDRYTIFTPDGSVYGMSDNALMPNGFNMYIGDNTEIEKGSHLGKKLKSVPESIKIAVERRMSEEYAKGGITEHGLKLGDKIIGASGSEGEILNVYNRGKQRRVNIQTGERSNFGYAKGGKLWIDTKGKGGLKGVKPSRKNTFRNEAVKRNMTSGQLATKVLASPSRYKGINPRSAQLVKNMGVRKQGGSIGDILRNRRGE